MLIAFQSFERAKLDCVLIRGKATVLYGAVTPSEDIASVHARRAQR